MWPILLLTDVAETADTPVGEQHGARLDASCGAASTDRRRRLIRRQRPQSGATILGLDSPFLARKLHKNRQVASYWKGEINFISCESVIEQVLPSAPVTSRRGRELRGRA